MSPSTYTSRSSSGVRHRITSTEKPKEGGAIGAPVVLVMLFVLMVIVDQSRGIAGAANPVRVPDAVVGTWIAKDARYAGRSIQIDPALVVIQRGEGQQATVGVVKGVRGWREGAQDVIRLEYEADGGDFSIDLMPQDRGGLRLRHPNEVLWVRR